MIQTAVMTWFPRSSNLGGAGWKEPETHLAAWQASSRLLSRQFRKVVLHTDRAGYAMLSGVACSDCVVRERVLDARLWGVEKLVSSSMTEEPHVHVDGDFFLWDAEPVRHAPIIYQCFEPLVRGYMRLRRTMRMAAARGLVRAPVGAGPIVCAGLAGGLEYEAFCRFASAQVEDARRLLSYAELDELAKGGGFAGADRFLNATNYWFEQFMPTEHFGRKRITPLVSNHQFHADSFDHVVRGMRANLTCLERVGARMRERPETRDLARFFLA